MRSALCYARREKHHGALRTGPERKGSASQRQSSPRVASQLDTLLSDATEAKQRQKGDQAGQCPLPKNRHGREGTRQIVCFDPINGKDCRVIGDLVDQSAEISAVQYVPPNHDRRIAVQWIIVGCCRATRDAVHEYLDASTLGSGGDQMMPTAIIDGGGTRHGDVRIARKKRQPIVQHCHGEVICCTSYIRPE